MRPVFSSVISSRLDDLLIVCKTCSVTSEPFRKEEKDKNEPKCINYVIVPLKAEDWWTHNAQIFAVEFGEPGVVRHGRHNNRQIPALTSHNSENFSKNTQPIAGAGRS